MSDTSGRAHVKGTRLYFEVAGSGPAAVLLHGFSLDTRMWDDQFDVLAREFRVVRYDQRGFGKSDVPTDEPYSGVEDLRSLLDYLAIETPHVIGLSLGGGLAIDFALTQPAMVDSLIVAGSNLSGYQWVHDGHIWRMFTQRAPAKASMRYAHAGSIGPSSSRDCEIQVSGRGYGRSWTSIPAGIGSTTIPRIQRSRARSNGLKRFPRGH